jgi:hypothetical protein
MGNHHLMALLPVGVGAGTKPKKVEYFLHQNEETFEAENCHFCRKERY